MYGMLTEMLEPALAVTAQLRSCADEALHDTEPGQETLGGAHVAVGDACTVSV